MIQSLQISYYRFVPFYTEPDGVAYALSIVGISNEFDNHRILIHEGAGSSFGSSVTVKPSKGSPFSSTNQGNPARSPIWVIILSTTTFSPAFKVSSAIVLGPEQA